MESSKDKYLSRIIHRNTHSK